MAIAPRGASLKLTPMVALFGYMSQIRVKSSSYQIAPIKNPVDTVNLVALYLPFRDLDEFPSSAAKATPQDQNDGSKKDHQRQCSEIADVQDNGGHCVNSMNVLVLAESERQCWLEKEASLQEMIKQLQNEKDLQIHREAGLEIKILRLQSEKDSWHHQEGSLEQEIAQLLQEKAALSVEEKKLQEKS
ncbi:hypothetical protein Nepgr_011892 [Nepenthes gracilis]|uniref:Uncharacterized protein n=1 Tax=Nepenthes gracilis TaxID=150966 RepID=A0AAD3XMR8_NEPGR|nr:hypothetical protein Nepgr_011892 [Nepenthes gracilis]